jgi:hypothetical protein
MEIVMEQISRRIKCIRFMREFGHDAELVINITSPVEVVHQGLVFVEGEDTVRYGITLRDANQQAWEFMSDACWFDPIEEEGFEEAMVDRVASLLGETGYRTAMRLQRADLLAINPEEWREEDSSNAPTGSGVLNTLSCERDDIGGNTSEGG